MATSKKQIFISYNHESQNIVKKIVEHLKEKDFNVWVDNEQLSAGDVWKKEIAKGITSSDLVICFISKKYCESENCIIEFEFTIEKKKPYIFVLLENLKKEEYNDNAEINAVRLSLSGKLQFYAYKPPNTFEPWSNDLFKELLKAVVNQIGENVAEIAQKKESNTNLKGEKNESVEQLSTKTAALTTKDEEDQFKGPLMKKPVQMPPVQMPLVQKPQQNPFSKPKFPFM